MAKEQKTKEELDKLLHEEVERYQLGSVPNIQQIDIVPWKTTMWQIGLWHTVPKQIRPEIFGRP